MNETHRPTKLQLTIQAKTGKKYTPFLCKHLLAAHGLLKSSLAELSLALVGDARMSRLHEQFMNISGPTDVLTFPLDFDANGREITGEVVICVPEAARQARRRGTRIERELLLYAIHGMLHLSGFDDRTGAAYRRMHRKENQILSGLGLGPVFGEINSRDAGHKPLGSPARIARSRAMITRVGD